MDSSAAKLPAIKDLPPSVVSFLNSTFLTEANLDLSASTQLVLELQSHCSQITKALNDLGEHLQSSLNSYDSYSHQIDGSINHIKAELDDLKSKSSRSISGSVISSHHLNLSPALASGKSYTGCVIMICQLYEEAGGEKLEIGDMVGMEELPALAKEVARIETVRTYAVTTLRLDTLVGDIEDAVSSVMSRSLRRHSQSQNSEEVHISAIDSLKKTEDVLTSITESHPQWTHLILAVDQRVDRALATLRPQAIADYRALLASFGWPPPLSSKPEARTSSEVSNPLLTIHGVLKERYSDKFLTLCSLQELQQRRKSRQLKGHDRSIATHQPLWVIEELANPLAVASQQYFGKWVDKPEYIFALSYKIAKDYVDSMDEVLQPLIDKAMLTGYSCREEWISAIVTSLLTYLAKVVFPAYISRMEKEMETATEGPSQAKMSWLHLVDLMTDFDKRIRPLAVHVGNLNYLSEDGNLQRISSLSIFSDRPDWFEIWLEIELGEIMGRLKPAIEDERNWIRKIQGSSVEDYKSPKISGVFLQQVSSIIERCRSMPTVAMRLKFVQLVGAPIIRKLLDCLQTKCLEAQGLTALADDEALIKVMNAINSAYHVAYILKEWSEDILFIEIATESGEDLDPTAAELSDGRWTMEALESGIFDPEIRKLEEFRKEWVDMIITVVLRGFDAQCREYLRNKKQWLEKTKDGRRVSTSFVAALDHLQQKMLVCEEGLNGLDFAVIWRCLAAGVDHMIFSGILMNYVKFSDVGVEIFGNDMEMLYGTFRAWCLRPEGFFPRSYEGLKVLKLDEKHIEDLFVRKEAWMHDNRIRHLSIDEVQRIVKCRIFTH